MKSLQPKTDIPGALKDPKAYFVIIECAGVPGNPFQKKPHPDLQYAADNTNGRSAPVTGGDYTYAEWAFLIEHFGLEEGFLSQSGLNTRSRYSQVKGRAILRGLIQSAQTLSCLNEANCSFVLSGHERIQRFLKDRRMPTWETVDEYSFDLHIDGRKMWGATAKVEVWPAGDFSWEWVEDDTGKIPMRVNRGGTWRV